MMIIMMGIFVKDSLTLVKRFRTMGQKKPENKNPSGAALLQEEQQCADTET